MGGRRLRRVVAGHAERAGLGRVVRLHRQHRNADSIVGWLILASLPAVVAVGALLLAGSPHWRPVVVGYAALSWGAAAWRRWGPIPDPDGRRWFVVAERGLLIWSTKSNTAVWAIPWQALRAQSGSLAWHEDGQVHELVVPAVSRRKALLRSIGNQTPGPSWSVRRLASMASAGLATVLVAQFAAVPLALDIIRGERPGDIEDLFRICAGGQAFSGAPPYRGQGPHPVAARLWTSHDLQVQADRLASDVVQLVACPTQIGRSSEALRSCTWKDGSTEIEYQGHYRVDVYEVRTGRKVTSFEIAGSSDVPPVLACAPYHYDLDDRPEHSEPVTYPAEAALAAQLSPLVDGKALG
ncbi:hypothetical protein ACTWLT_06935 [Micromonospora sp. ZYX-F-536]|uniref:hypothetical protein n=1 Tax=Micromonospora sp. ZYX-F-536 TaxID=3457629 RepID=UPI004040BBFD